MLSSVAASGFAGVLSPEQALKRIDNKGRHFKGAKDLTLKATYNDAEWQPAVYIFTGDSGEGFMIVSADDCVSPLLGYSDSGTLELKNLPPQLDYWIKQYSEEIGEARVKSKSCAKVTRANSLPQTPISPLVKTKWNQGTPYDKYTYYLKSDTDSVRSVTGCVATAMAQIMNYFQYPAVGKGEISYTHGTSGTYAINFADYPLQWSLMRDTYYPDTYTEAEGDAVAKLMKVCGYSVKMDYGLGESGASGSAPATALTEYFGYSEGITVESREWWTYDQWISMIYNNLSEVGPIIYNGSALDGGHSFICDGYDGQGYFHFNWGWGGMADGYYLLDALNPDEYGIGGAAGGYNLGQQIILGITSDLNADSPVRKLMQSGNLKGTIKGSTLSLELTDSDDPGMQYIDPAEVTVEFGVIVENVSKDTNEGVQYFKAGKTETAKMGSFYHWDEVGTTINLDDVKMAEGDTYDFHIATYINSEWSEVVAKPGHYNYVSVTKTSDGYEITNYSEADIKVSDFKVETATVYQDLPVKFSATFSNESATQLTRNYSAVFFDSAGKEQYKTENAGLTVDADSSLDHTWTSVQWYDENGAGEITEATTFTLKLYDNWVGRYVDGVETTVTVYPEPKDKKVEATLSLSDAEENNGVYIIQDTEFEVSITVKVESGYFSQPINLDIEVPQDNGYYSIQSQRFDAIPTLSTGEEQTLTMSIVFDEATPGQKYRLQAWSNGATLGDPLYVMFGETTGIGGIKADEEGLYKVYSISGLHILDTSESEDIANLPSGLYIINGVKILR